MSTYRLNNRTYNLIMLICIAVAVVALIGVIIWTVVDRWQSEYDLGYFHVDRWAKEIPEMRPRIKEAMSDGKLTRSEYFGLSNFKDELEAPKRDARLEAVKKQITEAVQ